MQPERFYYIGIAIASYEHNYRFRISYHSATKLLITIQMDPN